MQDFSFSRKGCGFQTTFQNTSDLKTVVFSFPLFLVFYLGGLLFDVFNQILSGKWPAHI